MSRPKDHIETSRWKRFQNWVNGETDILLDSMEIRQPEQPPEEEPISGASPDAGEAHPSIRQ